MKEEKNVKGSELISLSCTKKIVHQMMNCIGKIKLNDATGTGFFCKIPLSENKNINCLMTNYHVLNEKYFEENKVIYLLLNNDNEAKKIDLNIKRVIYYNKDYDTTIIEIKEEDKIKEYLELDDNILKDNEQIFYEGKSIYIIQYPKGQNGEEEACVSFGTLNKINEYNIIHKCSTDSGSSGSPILNLKNNKIIGIHKGTPDFTKNFNYGTLLKYTLNDFINQNKTKNNIIGEKDINKNKNNENIQIIKESFFEELLTKNELIKDDLIKTSGLGEGITTKMKLNNLDKMNRDNPNIYLENFKKLLSEIQQSKYFTKKEAICIANIIKINSFIPKNFDNNSRYLISLANRCEIIVEHLKLDKKEKWYLEF